MQTILSINDLTLGEKLSHFAGLFYLLKVKSLMLTIKKLEEVLRLGNIMCTVGYGDIIPTNNQEYIISIVIMLLACGIFAYAINSVGSITQDIVSQEYSIKNRLRTIEYLEYFWKEQSQYDSDLEQQILNDLSDSLKNQLQLQANKIVLQDNPIFKTNFSDKFIQKCVQLIKEQRFQPEQVIDCDEGEEKYIYFIESGQVEFFQTINKNQMEKQQQVLRAISRGDYFNHYQFFTGLNQQQKIKSSDFTKVFAIKRTEFLQLLKQFPEDQENFNYIKEQIIYNNEFGRIGGKCESCQRESHDFYNCHLIHFVPNQYKVIKRFNIMNSDQKTRMEFLRKKQKSKIWEDYSNIVENGLEYFQQNQSLIEDKSWILSEPSDSQITDIDLEDNLEFQSEQSNQQDNLQQEEKLNSHRIIEEQVEEEYDFNYDNQSDHEQKNNKQKSMLKNNKSPENSSQKSSLNMQRQRNNSITYNNNNFQENTKIQDYVDLNKFNNIDQKQDNDYDNAFENYTSKNFQSTSQNSTVRQKFQKLARAVIKPKQARNQTKFEQLYNQIMDKKKNTNRLFVEANGKLILNKCEKKLLSKENISSNNNIKEQVDKIQEYQLLSPRYEKQKQLDNVNIKNQHISQNYIQVEKQNNPNLLDSIKNQEKSIIINKKQVQELDKEYQNNSNQSISIAQQNSHSYKNKKNSQLEIPSQSIIIDSEESVPINNYQNSMLSLSIASEQSIHLKEQDMGKKNQDKKSRESKKTKEQNEYQDFKRKQNPIEKSSNPSVKLGQLSTYNPTYINRSKLGSEKPHLQSMQQKKKIPQIQSTMMIIQSRPNGRWQKPFKYFFQKKE
ncbi:Cyclic nucleotide-binding protein [Pseudocohnilembus persalinus]|uniref:Cyclic nucleotide-binding protein n=1 Tax=Pseudocohnilembus persalinus TaxID=266149 RepID=A0A0V0R834_PSEPJ|nr:Cyclic nucleotide-binding protein [Pseudocohnilembus persalinus]|eukprot:KRX10360.1 Cyclic nucleotide-binding protein [Pseudocohnilembus persalinus]